MPLNGIGTYSLTRKVAYNAVQSALSSGVRLIDTAYMYHNEEEIGKAIRDSGIPREEIFVITKIYPSQFDDPKSAIEMALEKLNIGYIDMMLLHHPGTKDVEAYKTMEQYVKTGEIHSLGLSNWYVEELKNNFYHFCFFFVNRYFSCFIIVIITKGYSFQQFFLIMLLVLLQGIHVLE